MLLSDPSFLPHIPYTPAAHAEQIHDDHFVYINQLGVYLFYGVSSMYTLLYSQVINNNNNNNILLLCKVVKTANYHCQVVQVITNK